MKFAAKFGVCLLALTLAVLPVAACVLPDAGMTAAEHDCCKKMAEQCGQAGMDKAHSCCQISAATEKLQALKTSATQVGDLNLTIVHSLPVSAPAISASVANTGLQILDVHDPPGLESLTTTVLRI